MPRTARKISRNGVYHIIIRGVNKSNIFLDKDDRIMFLRLLKYYSTKLKCKIYSYCLMSNHVHILMEDRNSKIGEMMKNITCVYAGEFNKKHGRIGHLFQDRFKSYSVESDNYLFCLIRYIHRNPEKAGLCATEKYKWSSYNEIVTESKIVDKEFILSLYSDNKIKAVNEFIMQMTGLNDDVLDSAYIEEKITDIQAKKLIDYLVKTKQIPEITEENLIEIVNKIKEIKGISNNQILRVLRFDKNKYYYMLKNSTKGVCPL